MRFCFGKSDWKDISRGQERCFLLTNGLGGYCSLSMVGSNDRNDQALLMAALVSPNKRYHILTNVKERLCMESGDISLYSQQVMKDGEIGSRRGYLFLNEFLYDTLPVWTYQAKGIELVKTVVMPQGENTVGIHYKVYKECEEPVMLEVTPLFQFVPKGKLLEKGQSFSFTGKSVRSNGLELFIQTDGTVKEEPLSYVEDLYYEKDARDGRDYLGRSAYNHRITFEITQREQEFYIIFSMEEGMRTMERMLPEARKHAEELINKSGIRDEIGRELVKGAYSFVSAKTSTGGKTILAGFPFFADWGRDTMIALPGCCIATGRYEDAKSILRSFMKYCHKGLMPNLFPEGEEQALYNTVDAALLFIQAVYEYYRATGDDCFVKEALPVMEEIIHWYRVGTDFHIRMDTDGLIMAGGELEQVTWMDVRMGDILPTPRHGKPVEISAYWYNALKIVDELREKIGNQPAVYEELAQQVKESFLKAFWMEEQGYLRDVVSVNEDNLRELIKYRHFEGRDCDRESLLEKHLPDEQMRPNQIWAVSLPYTMLSTEQAESVLKLVYEKLYTPYGLRSLSHDEEDYHPFYEGPQEKRDMAYHQGTVWPYPLGQYYLGYLKTAGDKEKAAATVRRQLESMVSCLTEGCLGHIAEVYDGEKPHVSKGCFAQAWSDGELLRVYAALEELERTFTRGKGMTGKEKKELFESASFEENFTYDGDDLGANYDKEKGRTTFKVWAPTASSVSVNFYRSGGEVDGDFIGCMAMEKEDGGVWSYSSPENLCGVYYTYLVTAEGEIKETGDIYAKACGVNGKRSMVVRLEETNPVGWELDRPVGKRKEAGTIYELHIKDFSNQPESGVREAYRGKYLAFTEKEAFCVKRLKELGISYVHLLPFYDYGSVDETGDANQFNWGYDPVNYLIPEGSYATNPYLGQVRIKEAKCMIQALHEAGIGVIMDVVFNHTYSLDSHFEKTVPGYYYRMDDSGKYTNGSACGNDTASDRKMYRKYMLDAVKYLFTEYHLDGMRFDLMGLHDVETMNEIRELVNGLPGGEELLIYGEPWSAGYSGFRKGAVPAVRDNLHLLSEGISVFCDYTRDSIKGSVFQAKEPGYVNTCDEEQRRLLTQSIKHSVLGWQGLTAEEFGCNYVRNDEGPYGGLAPLYPVSPRQIISYVSAHDNYTLWDKLMITRKDAPDFSQTPQEDILQMNKMAAGIVFTSLGQPFLQAGEEFARTKLGAGDSYNLSPDLNQLDYKRAMQLQELTQYYKGLIAIRKEIPFFGAEMERAYENLHFLDLEEPMVGYTLGNLLVYYNPMEQEMTVRLPGAGYYLLSDGTCFEKNPYEVVGNVRLKAKTVTILKT
ncbi:MAG: type I pullulanase [Lachnospiraceae bacterium]|nr:type I pullulanase [Lachnospiraceae bacterium]